MTTADYADLAPVVTVESLASMSRREIAEWITAIGGNVVALAAQRNEARAERDAVAQDLAQVATERESIRRDWDAAENERDELAARLAAVEALLVEREEEYGDLALPDLRALIRDLRAALAAPTDTTKEN